MPRMSFAHKREHAFEQRIAESARVRERDLAETSPTRRLYEVACEAIVDRHAAQGKHIPSAH